jgi:hypothetical protein
VKKLLLSIVSIPFFLSAQNSAPSGYVTKSIVVDDTKEVYFNFGAGTAATIDQTGWDIALYNESHEIGGKVNEAKGVKVWRVYKDTSSFSTVTLADTLNPAYNSDNFMYLGALDTIYTGNTTNYFTIGLGRFFSGGTYTARGDKIFIIRRSDGVYGKFYLKSYTSATRIFILHYANIDNTDVSTIDIPKSTPTGATKHYQYLNLTTKGLSGVFESASYNDWDVVLRKSFVGASRTAFPVGVFTNNVYNLIRHSKELGAFAEGLPDVYLRYGYVSTEAYEATGNTLTTNYNGSLSSFEPISRLNNQIGVSWYNTATGLPKQNMSYFLRDKDGKVWHLIFTNYTSATKTVDLAFNKVFTHNASVTTADQSMDLLGIVVRDGILQVENKTNGNCEIEIFDFSGKRLLRSNFSTVFVIDELKMDAKLILIKVSNDKIQKIFKVLY